MKRYARFVIPALGLVVVLMGFLLFNLKDSLVFFRTPTEVVEDTTPGTGDRMRLGGQVVGGTVEDASGGVAFDVSDGVTTIAVVHTGAPPQLFQEGIGVVITGTWDGNEFRSDEMMVKHDEQYRTEDGDVYVPGAEYIDEGSG